MKEDNQESVKPESTVSTETSKAPKRRLNIKIIVGIALLLALVIAALAYKANLDSQEMTFDNPGFRPW
ncbi:MAG TPA: hypothetical protein V6C81_21215 [Planktothrix sp.]